jgi:hypothetical protein
MECRIEEGFMVNDDFLDQEPQEPLPLGNFQFGGAVPQTDEEVLQRLGYLSVDQSVAQ